MNKKFPAAGLDVSFNKVLANYSGCEQKSQENRRGLLGNVKQPKDSIGLIQMHNWSDSKKYLGI